MRGAILLSCEETSEETFQYPKISFVNSRAGRKKKQKGSSYGLQKFSNFGSQNFTPTGKEVKGIDAKHKGGGSRLDKTEKIKFFKKVAVKNRIFIPTTYEEYFFKHEKEVVHE